MFRGKAALVLICLLLLAGAPWAAWACFRPLRILLPEMAGVSCPDGLVCVDDLSRYDEARKLYASSLDFVGSTVGAVRKNPRVIFCGSERCFESFGQKKPSGVTYGTFGIVIAPRGWKPYYVRHEMIHHLQAERLGTLGVLFSPKWFREGMAYSLSQDPRSRLEEPWQTYRAQFDAWYRGVGKEGLWSEAKKL